MTASVCHKRTTCRVCGSDRLYLFLSLGPQPLANAFLSDTTRFGSESRYPLDVYFCESCSLVQLLDVIDPEVLFREYIYVTGTSETIAAHNVSYARAVVDLLRLGESDLVVEIASNDGSLLQQFRACGVKTLGIEPARNLAEIARAKGIATIDRFFESEVGKCVRGSHGPARAVIANNVLAHVDETRDFLCGARELIADDGLVIMEVPYLRDLVNRLEYDTIYHEHLCYFSATTLARLCEAADLSLVRVDYVPVHGGSLRMYAGRREYHPSHTPAVMELLEQERREGLTSRERYVKFAGEVAENRRAILDLLENLSAKRKVIAGYGAPAKGNTLLNYCGIGPDLLPFTVDKNQMKVGKFTPGTHIPVEPVERLLERQPDCVLILAWNFAEEIMRQQSAYRTRGGSFIIPIPSPMVV